LKPGVENISGFFFINFSSFVLKYFFDNKIISGEPCKGGSLVEKIISKDSEACRAGSLGEWKSCEIENGESV